MSIAAQIAKSPKYLVRLIPTIQSRFVPSRLTSSRAQCKKRQDPPKSTDDPCGIKRPQIAIKKKKKPRFISMWENPECCIDPCPEVFPRYDEMWEETDKAKRVYTRTWKEAPKIRVITKKVCCYGKKKYPPFKKRKPNKDRPKTAKQCGKDDSCRQPDAKTICPKISMPCCTPGRQPPSCVHYRPKEDCQKICTPYPSFSECAKDPRKYGRPIECNCLRIVALCEVMMRARKLQAMKKK